MKDIKTFCRLYYASTYIPISAYTKTGEQICSFSSFAQNYDINQPLLHIFIQLKQNPGIHTSASFGYYGIIHIEESQDILVIGPVYNTPITHKIVHSFIRECQITQEHKDDASQFLSSLPRTSYHQFISILDYIYYCLCDERLPQDYNRNIFEDFSNNNISVKYTNSSYESKEMQAIHNSYEFEQQVLKLIEDGKPDMVKKYLLEHAGPLYEGILAYSPLRQAQNIFIGWITMVGKKAAIDGGLDVEQTYSLIDIYIQECERLQTFESIINLQYRMMIDFASRVKECHIPAGISPLIFSCIQYINNHINEAIQIDNVINHTGKSRSYVVDLFKKELGFNMGEYIIHCKLNEAKNLLLYSDKTMSEISNYLCFSSQSYFITVFKKTYGMTPKQFQLRNKSLTNQRNSLASTEIPHQ